MSWWKWPVRIAAAAAAPFTGGASLAAIPMTMGRGQTPGYNPNASTPGQSNVGGNADDSSWIDLLPQLMNAGLNITGTALQSRAQNRGNEEIRQRTAMMDQLARDEMKRRDYYASLLLPNLMRGMGRSREQIAEHMRSNPLTRS